ncbi:hypothetical protein NJBCHELONAE_43390 [Mycobacteroides chelonae]|uniref:hypothetical protein n=1 Tax=Mycobacteroides chelonae TaxID=1774 RepID=UPI0021DD906E|nr:hypothetical protein [Mycobacteroides chelonae]GLE59028.1 hypothetical protein NJBCHELONAE_43390 [Mycobacteroides chelonae]
MTLGTEPRPPARGPGYGYQPAGTAVQARGPRRGLTPVIAGVALVVGVGIGAIGGVSLAGKESAAPAADVPRPTMLEPALSPAAAKAQTCTVLKTDYEAVANAIDARNRYTTNDWSDAGLLASTNHLVTATSDLANSLDKSLLPETPADVRAGVNDYVAALRALGTSQRNHAPSTQLNGVGEFYNQVVDIPLRLCGIQG